MPYALKTMKNMKIKIFQKKIKARGIKFVIKDGKKEVGRAYLYILKNDLHARPFGFLEDVFVDATCRGGGAGTLLAREAIKTARRTGCYKLICTSRDAREGLHQWYEKLGFQDYGREFRMNFK